MSNKSKQENDSVFLSIIIAVIAIFMAIVWINIAATNNNIDIMLEQQKTLYDKLIEAESKITASEQKIITLDEGQIVAMTPSRAYVHAWLNRADSGDNAITKEYLYNICVEVFADTN